MNRAEELAAAETPASIDVGRYRLGTIGLGVVANKLFVWGWNYGVYPLVLWFGGLLWGSLLMVGLNFAANYGTLRFYDWAKRDWLGIELAKEFKDYAGSSRFWRLTGRFMSRTDWLALPVLSLLSDPFITTAYLRRGANRYDGMGRREWRIFLTSFVISTGAWIAVTYGGLTLLRSLF